MEGRTEAIYGLIAAAHLAQNDGWIPAKVVAAAYGLPTGYMFKTMHALTTANILRGKKAWAAKQKKKK